MKSILLVTTVAAAALAGACTRPAVRVHGMQDDLAQLATEIARHHPGAFAKIKEPDWRHAVEDLDQRISSLDEPHLIVGFERIVAMIGDAHTRLFIPHTHTLPLRFLWFDDGVVVAGASADASWAIGKKVVAVGHRSIENAVATLAGLLPSENEADMKDEVMALLADQDALAGTDLVLGDDATFTLEGGKELRVAPGGSPPPLALPKTRPLHLQGPTQLAYWNKYVDDQRLLYFQYNACADDARVGPFAQFAASTLAFADQHPVDRFVIDLRSNSGGDSRIIEPLIEGLARRPALAGRVFVLIGRATFSSGMLNAIELKARVGATLVGTPTGGNPNGWGEVKTFELSYSHWKAQYSTKRFANARYPGTTVPPDVRVRVTSDDWFSGRDPAIDAVLAAPVPHP